MNHAGATVPVQSIKACVVYDPSNGRIYHGHRVLTLNGGREPTESEIEADALRAVGKRREPPGGTLKVLHVHHEAIERGKRYRVDVRRKELVVD
jgi:hypothetical protein